MEINYLYRISDAGNPKLKLDIASKMFCLDNFINEFKQNIHIFADNCGEETLNAIRKRDIEPNVISLGNSKSWQHIVQFAIDNFPKNSFVYLVEDDYIHLSGSAKALEEGLKISDYVSLYDHPDKYINFADGGPNPYIKEGGEHTTVLLTKNSHWKYTNSTTMTFATSVKVLLEDKELWWHFTSTSMPDDFFAFQTFTLQKKLLSKQFYRKTWSLLSWRRKVKKKRTLISPIPSLATHAEIAWLAPLTIWHKKKTWNDI